SRVRAVHDRPAQSGFQSRSLRPRTAPSLSVGAAVRTRLDSVATRARDRQHCQARSTGKCDKVAIRATSRGQWLKSYRGDIIVPQQNIWFFVSIAFSLTAWGIITARYIWPELRLRQRAEALRPLLILHSFRFIGLAFLVPGVVSPDLPPT